MLIAPIAFTAMIDSAVPMFGDSPAAFITTPIRPSVLANAASASVDALSETSQARGRTSTPAARSSEAAASSFPAVRPAITTV